MNELTTFLSFRNAIDSAKLVVFGNCEKGTCASGGYLSSLDTVSVTVLLHENLTDLRAQEFCEQVRSPSNKSGFD